MTIVRRAAVGRPTNVRRPTLERKERCRRRRIGERRRADHPGPPSGAAAGGETTIKFREEDRVMRKLLSIAIALALALVSMLPGIAAAKLAANHNQTPLRG